MAASQAKADFDDFFEEFFRIYPRPGSPQKTKVMLRQAIDAGSDPESIIAGAKVYAEEQSGNEKRFMAYSENWIRDRKWECIKRSEEQDFEEMVQKVDMQRVEAIRKGQTWVGNCIKAEDVRHLVDSGTVTLTECKAAGILL